MSEEFLIELLQKEYDAYCQKMLPSEEPYRFNTRRHDDGSLHLEVWGDKYHLVVTERGSELERFSTGSKEEAMYRLLSAITFEIASDYELKNRIEGRDFRRMLFAKQVGFMREANPKWAERLEKEVARIVKGYPYNDDE